MRRNSFISALVQQCKAACPTTRNTASTCPVPVLYAPTLAPTSPSPTPRPTQAIRDGIAVALTFSLEGVSTNSWVLNETVYDSVMVRTIVLTISNSAIQPDQVTIISIGPYSPPNRRLDEGSSGSGGIEVTYYVKADDVLGLTDALIISMVEDAVADSTFTRNLHEAAVFYGASGLYEVTVMSVSGSSAKGASNDDDSEAIDAVVITAIVLAVMFTLLLAGLIYLFSKGTVKRSTRKAQQTAVVGNPLHPDQASVQTIKPTQNPLHTNRNMGQVYPPSNSGNETENDSVVAFYGKL